MTLKFEDANKRSNVVMIGPQEPVRIGHLGTVFNFIVQLNAYLPIGEMVGVQVLTTLNVS